MSSGEMTLGMVSMVKLLSGKKAMDSKCSHQNGGEEGGICE